MFESADAQFARGTREKQDAGLKPRATNSQNRQDTAAVRRLGGGAGWVGVEAFFVEEEDAGAEGEEHDGEAGGDAETGDDGGGTVLATADDDVAGDGD
jgi:hypothetical protein